MGNCSTDNRDKQLSQIFPSNNDRSPYYKQELGDVDFSKNANNALSI
jgi:hypothetical protein